MKDWKLSSFFDCRALYISGVPLESLLTKTVLMEAPVINALVMKLTHSSELAIEFGVGENESRRAAVGAVMGVVDEVTLFEIDLFQHHGITGDQQCIAAELFDSEAETVEHFGVFQNELGFFGAHFNGEWDEQLLRFY